MKRSQRLRYIALLATAFLFAVVGILYLVDSAASLSLQSAGFSERFTQVEEHEAPWLIERQGGYWGRYGWYLRPGETGLLRLKLPGKEVGELKLRLWAWNTGQLQAWIEDAANRLPIDKPDGDVCSFLVHGETSLYVRATNLQPTDRVILDRLDAAWFPTASNLPPAWPLFAAAVLLIAAWGWICAASSVAARRSWIGGSFILLAALTGLALRMDLLDLARALPLDPDVVGYLQYAQSLDWFTPDHGFYSGTFREREPLHVAALNLWLRLLGSETSGVRLYTVILSTALIVAVGIFFWCLSRRWWFGALGAWAMAVNAVLIEESVRGLRLEAFCLLFLGALAAWRWGRGWKGAMLMGVTVGVLALLRAPGLSVMLPLMWGAWLLNVVRERLAKPALQPIQWRLGHILLASAIGIGLFAPHLYGLYKVHGDAAWPSYGYARWNANLEFPERIGTPGFPTKEEFDKSPYAGPKITYWQYMFGLHSVPQLIIGQIKGWLMSSSYMAATLVPGVQNVARQIVMVWRDGILDPIPWGALTGAILCVILTGFGWLRLLAARDLWWLPLMALWGTWYAAYLYSVQLVEPFRHTGHVYPLLLFCLLWGGAVSVTWVARRLRMQAHVGVRGAGSSAE